MPAPPAAQAAAASMAAALDIAANASALDALYPCSDGRPMSDNMHQSRAIVKAVSDLDQVARPDALVAADILVYPEEGNPDNRIAPDVLVAFGIGTRSRSTYLTWLEGKPPDWVLEVASPSSARNDLREKRRAYAAMGVPEYWLFDPTGDLYPRGQPRLRGLALVDGKYEPLEERVEGGLRLIRSPVLGLDLRAQGGFIRFRDPATGEDVRHHRESEAAAKRQAKRAECEAAQRRAAEARARAEAVERKAAVARAERQAKRARAEAAQRRAAEARAEREAERAKSEAAERSAAQARVAELEAALRLALQRPLADSSDDHPP